MEKEGGGITLLFNEQGDFCSVDLGRGPQTEPTHNLYNKLPPGQYVGSMDLGQIYVYKQPDGTLMRCVKIRCHII